MKVLKLNTLPFYFFLYALSISSCSNNAPKKVKAIVISKENTQDFEQGYIEPKQGDTLITQN